MFIFCVGVCIYMFVDTYIGISVFVAQIQQIAHALQLFSVTSSCPASF